MATRFCWCFIEVIGDRSAHASLKVSGKSVQKFAIVGDELSPFQQIDGSKSRTVLNNWVWA